MQRTIFLSVCAAFLASGATARAGLTVTIPSATVYTNATTATLDVDITGDGSTSFGAFTLKFQITADASNTLAPLETLEFVAPPSNPSADPTLNSKTYVFYGNSLGLSPPVTAFGNVSGTDNTTLTVTDNTADFSDVTLANGTSALLARLEFTVPTNLTNSGGDKFDVTLVNPNTSPTALQSNVNFPSDVQMTSGSGPFTSVITLESPAVSTVPEPSTFGMLMVGAMGMLWVKRRRTAGMGWAARLRGASTPTR